MSVYRTIGPLVMNMNENGENQDLQRENNYIAI